MNVAKNIENAESAQQRVDVAQDDLFNLDEYEFFDAKGAPEGSIYAVDYEEAGRLWALENLRHNGDSRLLQVKGPRDEGYSCTWLEVRRERENAWAREVSW